MRKATYILAILMITLTECGCVSYIWTGANIVYDRHNLYKKVDDMKLASEINKIISKDANFKCYNCSIDVAVFNRDILLAGHLPSPELISEIQSRVSQIPGYRRLFNQLSVGNYRPNDLNDSWITTKIRAQMITDSDINQRSFKIITSDSTVYLMGDVKLDQAQKVIEIARNTNGVLKVVEALKYFNYVDSSESTKNG